MLSIKCEIRQFHTKTAKKCPKKRDASAKLLFCLSNLLNISLMFSLPSCCWIFKSLMFPAKQEEVLLFDILTKVSRGRACSMERLLAVVSLPS